MAGLDLPTKLRRGLGEGRVLSDAELAGRLGAYDKDGDGHLTKAELRRFLADGAVGGPWFCEMLANTIWKKSQQAFEREVSTLGVPLLARVLHFAMSRTQRPARRYVITPEAVRGEAPRLDPQNEPVDEAYGDLGRGPAPRRPPVPRGPTPGRSAPPRGRPPGPAGAPRSGPAPRGRPAPPRAGGRPDPARGPVRSPARPGPKRPSGRSRS